MQKSAAGDAGRLAPAEEAEAFQTLPGHLDRGLLILCDHATNALPSAYGTLGLGRDELERHIAVDVGAAGVARRVARALGVPAVMTRFSRLLIDCNRGLDDPTLIVRVSDGTVVPGNRRVDDAERQRRIARYYEPYHRAIDRLIDRAIGLGAPPALVSIHSFTGTWRGQPRPWHAAVLRDDDPWLAPALLRLLSEDGTLTVGDNEPYSGRLEGDCLWRHGTVRGLPHAVVEVRQDLIGGEEGQQVWGDRLAGVLGRILAEDAARPDLNGAPAAAATAT